MSINGKHVTFPCIWYLYNALKYFLWHAITFFYICLLILNKVPSACIISHCKILSDEISFSSILFKHLVESFNRVLSLSFTNLTIILRIMKLNFECKNQPQVFAKFLISVALHISAYECLTSKFCFSGERSRLSEDVVQTVSPVNSTISKRRQLITRILAQPSICDYLGV